MAAPNPKGKYPYDYRKEFFKHNPGLFGKVWICAYCGRLIFGRHNLQVDHIYPKSKVGNTRIAKAVVNQSFNLVAACGKCNRKKSNKRGFIVLRGYFAKGAQSAASPFLSVFEGLIRAVFSALATIIKVSLNILFALVLKSWWLWIAIIAYYFFFTDKL